MPHVCRPVWRYSQQLLTRWIKWVHGLTASLFSWCFWNTKKTWNPSWETENHHGRSTPSSFWWTTSPSAYAWSLQTSSAKSLSGGTTAWRGNQPTAAARVKLLWRKGTIHQHLQEGNLIKISQPKEHSRSISTPNNPFRSPQNPRESCRKQLLGRYLVGSAVAQTSQSPQASTSKRNACKRLSLKTWSAKFSKNTKEIEPNVTCIYNLSCSWHLITFILRFQVTEQHLSGWRHCLVVRLPNRHRKGASPSSALLTLKGGNAPCRKQCIWGGRLISVGPWYTPPTPTIHCRS